MHINRWEFTAKRLKCSYVSNIKQKRMMVDAAVDDVGLFLAGNLIVTAEYDSSGRVSSSSWMRLGREGALEFEALKGSVKPGNSVKAWTWFGSYPRVGAN